MRFLPFAAAAFLTVASLPAQNDALGKTGAMLLKEHAASIVTLNVVVKLEFMGQSREQRINGRGVLVHESGLILADVQIAAPSFNANSGGKRIDIKVTPLEFKVVFESEEDELEAFLVGKDSKLGFAFLKLKDGLPKAHAGHVLDYSSAKKPKVGEQTVTVSRLSKGYDYAPAIGSSRILGVIKKPRKAWILAGSAATGLPVWNVAGELIGCQGRIASSLSAARPGTGQAVVLRGGLVAAAVKQALKQAEELAKEKKDEKKDGKKDGEGEKKEEKKMDGEGK
ncbi:MAG: hypothetical protein CSA62_11450 [Planctomycetota bacterium]|nr:MAG: hypothetical protein CSA62_11450 [Planctomycetota bacterium]